MAKFIDLDTGLPALWAKIKASLNEKVDSGYVQDGVAHFTSNGTELFSITGIGGGGGGGGSDNSAIIRLSNASGWLSKTIADGSECMISVNWSSTLDGEPTGNGKMAVSVNGSSRLIMNVAQGTVSFDASEYLVAGSNIVKVTVSDAYDNVQTINYTVNVISLVIRSSFDALTPKEGEFVFSYIPTGNVDKTVYFIVDGETIGTVETPISGRQQSFTIPAQSHGSHTLKVYFEATINAETVRSNELYYDVICIESGVNRPVIASTFTTTEAEQYTTFLISYTVYNPSSLTTPVTLKANNTVINTVTVDRTEQKWSYRADDPGELTLEIVAGRTTKTFNVTIEESRINFSIVTDDLALSLSSAGRSNTEEHPEIWEDRDVVCNLTGFNFASDGWVTDDDGNVVLRVSGDARVTIPYEPFQNDFTGTGKTIEIDFATRNVMNYDSVIFSCMDGNRGIELRANAGVLQSQQSAVNVQYKEEEHIRLTFVVEKVSEYTNRLFYVYLNGVMCGVIQYPTTDNFSQNNPQIISIGSNTCTIDIYSIRIYDNDLTRSQVLENWVVDTQNIDEMLARYSRNNIYNEYDDVVIAKLPNDLPYMIISCPELPKFKGDKKTVSVTYIDPINSSKSFTAVGVEADVQGTSSQYYARKNYKLKYKQGFMLNGLEVDDYSLTNDCVPTNVFTMKADVASSEGANNVELARLYNDACPYKTPAQVENPAVRQGIDGYPMVIFWDNGTETTFLGKYNFNNDKSSEEVFGFVDGDESWEIRNNTSDRVKWKSDDYTSMGVDEDSNPIPDWLNDFEARYPDTKPAYTDSTQLHEFASWVKSTDRTTATNAELQSSVVYGGVTYTHDTPEYRLAKFKAEVSNYMEIDSAVFYYLFTELFLMVDSRAKNAFPSFMGGVV